MTESTKRGQEAVLSIGELAERTGISAPTLRMWEQRHGFPVAQRLPSGHRRYREDDVALVQQVARRRDSGIRLEQAIAGVRTSFTPPAASVFAELRRLNPALPVHRLSKSTLIAMSWAIEDEFVAQARRPRLYGAFQRAEFYAASRRRWHDLARVARSTTVFADFDDTDPVTPTGEPRRVALAPDAPMRNEWALVCEADDLPVVLTAWELPGQAATADERREFEAMWSLRPADVHAAARACAAVAGADVTTLDAGTTPALVGLRPVAGDERASAVADPVAAAALFARMVAYVDRRAR